jgi:hypothetical protein
MGIALLTMAPAYRSAGEVASRHPRSYEKNPCPRPAALTAAVSRLRERGDREAVGEGAPGEGSRRELHIGEQADERITS